jgi:phosphatidylinositol-3,4,5-trisphosphate 3-phosphatase/dual-specificity protein phosphatase PTEN
VINLSGKKYDNSKFENRVLEYEWVDHHAPPLKILFSICQEIHNFFADKEENVIAVNCMAGKGRTGTIICCYLLFCGRFEKADDAFDYYSKKRFSKGDGVTQPSQKRYVYYFERLLKEKIFFPYFISITDISVNKFPHNKDDALRPYMEIYLENNDKVNNIN